MKKFTVTMKTLSVQQKEIFAENDTEALEIANSEDWHEKEEILWVDFETDSPLDFIESNQKKIKTQKTQLELYQEIVRLSDINIVTCGNCSSVILHEVHQEEITCPDCGYTSEPCDFPDLNY